MADLAGELGYPIEPEELRRPAAAALPTTDAAVLVSTDRA